MLHHTSLLVVVHQWSALLEQEGTPTFFADPHLNKSLCSSHKLLTPSTAVYSYLHTDSFIWTCSWLFTLWHIINFDLYKEVSSVYSYSPLYPVV